MTTREAALERSRQIWASADFSPLAASSIWVGELLVRAVDVHHGERVLDVAAGTGNTAIAAARRGAIVTASDFVPAMVEKAMRRAEVEGLPLRCKVGDVEELPFEDASFDVVLSTFGAMFGADHPRTASELLRVCRPGGRIGLANWTPDGLIGGASAIGKASPANSEVPPAAGASPYLWGTEQHCRELFGARVSSLRATAREFEFCAASARAQVELLRRSLGPVRALFESLDREGQERLATQFAEVFERRNRATDGTLVSVAAYLEVVAVVA